jgi:hypothetical protein
MLVNTNIDGGVIGLLQSELSTTDKILCAAIGLMKKNKSIFLIGLQERNSMPEMKELSLKIVCKLLLGDCSLNLYWMLVAKN